MTKSHRNRVRIDELRESLDLKATEEALERGEITPRQAVGLRTWIANVIEIRENPITPIADTLGRWIGEVITRSRGSSWIGRRYGKDYPKDAREFSEYDKAVAFVRQGCSNEASS